MSARSPRLWIAIVSAVAVAGVALVDLRRASPGPLAAVHVRVDELAGRRGCGDCHGGWTRSMSAACLDCHDAIGAQLADGSGLHGRLAPGEGRRCAACHSDHHGASFAMVNRRSFVRAGVADPSAFDHSLVGFSMEGAHLALDCAECHAHARAAVLPPGGRRYLGLAADCAGCHDDPHEGRMALACADCHGQESFAAQGLAAPGHAEHLPLVGGHGGLACAACHEDGGGRSLEAAGTRPGARAARTCLDCHGSPHDERFVAGVARLEGSSEGASCGACHAAEHTSFRDEALEIGTERHACSGFPLAPPHDRAACADCHGPQEGAFEARYPGREADACETCHEDPHAGQFAAEPQAVGCLGCHARERFEPHLFGRDEHARTDLELTGAHAELACEACHVVSATEAAGVEPGTRVFRGTPAACAACHADAHDGFFDGPPEAALAEAPAPAAQARGCARCHGTTRFDELLAGGFDHGPWTGFVLRGAHLQSACESCHPRRDEPDATGRRFGRVAERFGPYEGCATCHADPHRGGFDGPGAPSAVDGRTGCARCHGETSFRALPGGFEHGRWTGFPLEDAHAEAGCADCHREPPPRAGEPGAGAGPGGARPGSAVARTLGLAPGSACADCHEDPHAGQFDEGHSEGGAQGTDCSRCHESAASFARLSFVHDFDSRFVLGEAHADLECSACHFPASLGGREVVRYRPLGRRCTDCHEADPDPLRRLRRKGR